MPPVPSATCPVCSRRVVPGQRYCLHCGHRVAEPVVDRRVVAGSPPPAGGPRAALPTAAHRRAPRPKTAAVLLLAALGTGTLLGAAGVPAPAASGADRPVIAYVAPAATPEPAAPAAPAAGASLPDDVPAGEGAHAAAAPAATATPAAGSTASTDTSSTDTSAGDDAPAGDDGSIDDAPPPAKHVVIVSLTGHHVGAAFGPGSPATYLSSELAAQGTLLPHYRGVAGGAAANALTLMTGVAEPADDAASLPAALADMGRTWKAYVQGATSPCTPSPRDPFPGLPSLQDCATADVSLDALEGDFSDTDTAPSLAYVIPDGCHDGSDGACPQVTDGTTGLERADAWLREWVPKITESPAFADDGLLVVLFDGDVPDADRANGPRVGAVVVSRFARKGAVSPRRYDPVGLLRTLAGIFGVDAPGKAGRDDARALGRDVFPKRARDHL
jgi:hypothetical protein